MNLSVIEDREERHILTSEKLKSVNVCSRSHFNIYLMFRILFLIS